MDTVWVNAICMIAVLLIVLQKFKKLFEEKIVEMDRKVGEKFENVSNKAIKESLGFVQDSSMKEVSKLISPINEQLRSYEMKVNDQLRAYQEKMDRLMKDDAIDRAKMRENFNTVTSRVIEMNKGLTEDAKAFTKAMRGDIRALGKFGEDKAEMIFVASGFNEGREFLKQKMLSSDVGNIKPDFVIKLPDNRAVFVDSKMSLDSFMSYMEAEEEGKRNAFAKEFLERIKDHIKTLCRAGYQKCTEYQSMDYVMMFVGSDRALSLALDMEPDLQRDALKKGILLVGPTTLMCSLKSIEFLSREQRQIENLKSISEVGGHLYTKLTYFLDNLRKANECLDKSSEAMKKALNHLNRGEKSILADARKLNELGGFSAEPLPKIEDME
jgi:DNA recombination protein RmuC